jgi:hypothetical protein
VIVQDGEQPWGFAAKQALVVVLEFQAACAAHIPSHDIWSILHLGVARIEASVNSEHSIGATTDESGHSLTCVCLCGAVCQRVPQVLGCVHEPGYWRSHTSICCCVLFLASRFGTTSLHTPKARLAHVSSLQLLTAVPVCACAYNACQVCLLCWSLDLKSSPLLLFYAGERESLLTYSTLFLVVGGVIVASGVEPSLNLYGAAVCFLGAAFRGLRAVMQVNICSHSTSVS